MGSKERKWEMNKLSMSMSGREEKLSGGSRQGCVWSLSQVLKNQEASTSRENSINWRTYGQTQRKPHHLGYWERNTFKLLKSNLKIGISQKIKSWAGSYLSGTGPCVANTRLRAQSLIQKFKKKKVRLSLMPSRSPESISKDRHSALWCQDPDHLSQVDAITSGSSLYLTSCRGRPSHCVALMGRLARHYRQISHFLEVSCKANIP